MISWRSFTTSKVLPTFVGESFTSGSTSYSRTAAPRIDGQNLFRGALTETSYESFTNNRTLSYRETRAGATAKQYVGFGGQVENYTETGEVENNGELAISSAIVIQNSTIRGTVTETSPLATARQETSTTQDWERRIQITTTISAYDAEDEDGNALNSPIVENIWTTTSTVLTDATGGTRGVTNFDFTTINTTETVQSFKIVPSTRTVTTTTGGDVVFTTYTHPEGDVVVIANTIWESVPNAFAGGYVWRSAVTANSPNSETPLTALAYAPSRFTVLYSEFIETLPVRADSASTIPVTTRQTQKTGHETTRVGFAPDNYTGWNYSFETRACENRTGGVNRRLPRSFPVIRNSTFEEPTQVNTTTTTFETYFGWDTVTQYKNNTTEIVYDPFEPADQKKTRTSTFFVPNTVSEQTTTFQISGQLLKDTWVSWPGLSEKNILPWFSTGDGNRRFYNLPNNATTLLRTTSRLVTFGNSWNIVYNDENVTQGLAGTRTQNWQNIKVGQFFTKRGIQIQNLPAGAATQISANQLDGLASPALTYATQNTHSTVGVFMTANAQHTWEGNFFVFGNQQGSISQNIIGAVPFQPSFTGIIRRNAEGWELCDTSEYTSVQGSRVGSQFSTTIAWQTVEGTSTSSGEFTMNSTNSAEFGVRQQAQTIAGGFQTPNAARTVIASPGALITTTYNSAGSGSGSSSFATGTSFTTAPIGPVPITLSSFIRKVQGYGAIELNLIDNGLP